MSTCLRAGLAVISLAAALAVGGCPDPAERLAEFESRIPDAAQVITYDAAIVSEIPDISGTALLVIHIGALSINLQNRVEVTYTPLTAETGTISMMLRFLTANAAREPVGDPLTFSNVAVDNTASFTITIPTLEIPPQANPLGNSATAQNVVLRGTIQSADLACGTVAGMVTMPITLDLAGSTFGAKRVPTGSTGAALGDPVTACP